MPVCVSTCGACGCAHVCVLWLAGWTAAGGTCAMCCCALQLGGPSHAATLHHLSPLQTTHPLPPDCLLLVGRFKAACAQRLVCHNPNPILVAAFLAPSQALTLLLTELTVASPNNVSQATAQLQEALRVCRLTLFTLDVTVAALIQSAHIILLVNAWRGRQAAAVVTLSRHALCTKLILAEQDRICEMGRLAWGAGGVPWAARGHLYEVAVLLAGGAAWVSNMHVIHCAAAVVCGSGVVCG